MSNYGWASSHLYISGDPKLLDKVESYINSLNSEPYLEAWGKYADKSRLSVGFSDGEMYSDFDRDIIDFCKNLEFKFGLKLSGYVEQQVDGDTYIVEYTSESYNAIDISELAALGVAKLKQIVLKHIVEEHRE